MEEYCDPTELGQFVEFASRNDMTKYINRRRGYELLMRSVRQTPTGFTISASDFDKLTTYMVLPDFQVTQNTDRGTAVPIHSFTVLLNNLRRKLRDFLTPVAAPAL